MPRGGSTQASTPGAQLDISRTFEMNPGFRGQKPQNGRPPWRPHHCGAQKVTTVASFVGRKKRPVFFVHVLG